MGLNLKSVNCSFGGENFANAERVLVNELGKKGVIACYASGNGAFNNDLYPAGSNAQTDAPTALVVNAANPSFEPTDYTQYGQNTTSLFSPGDAILSPVCVEAARYYPSIDRNRRIFDTFDDSSSVKVMYLDTYDITENTVLSINETDFLNLISNDNWQEAGTKVSGSESFDNDGCSYQISVPKLNNESEKAVYLVSVPVDQADAAYIALFGFAAKS